MALLEVTGISKNFGSTHVLQNISLNLEKGEALAIIGSSGSGKTTLLRCLNFLETPDTGVIRVDGKTLWDAADPATHRESEVRKKRLHFGLVFQNFNLFPQYTALQNITLAGELLAKEKPEYKANRKAIHAELEEKARTLLAQMGLSEAKDSLRHARTLLDEAHDMRANNALYLQRRQALVSRRTALEETLDASTNTRNALYEDMGFRPERGTIEAVDAFVARKTRQREGLMENSEHLNRRYGELSQILAHGRSERTFDELKLRYQELQTRRDQSAMEFAKLLLARRMLETAIAAWESKSQPEVYARASKLLADMTDGKWTSVSMSREGRLQVSNDMLTTREPVHLSLGTCQQLYLALRIALLITADNVGRNIPIIADDILVNFDSKRRAAAARALAELARHRQVIMLTCHEEIVDTMRLADSSLNEVVL